MSAIQPGPSHLLIGAGRLSHHLSHYFKLKNLRFQSWSRNEGSHRLAELSKTCDKVWVCITDSEIEGFINQYWAILEKKQIFHCSGSLFIDKAIGVHPLMTFSKDKLYTLDIYKSIPFIVDQKISVQEIDPELQNLVHTISKDQKPLYHALCVVGGNFPQMLASICEEELHKIGIQQVWFRSYLLKSIENYIESGKLSLTGPLIRKDKRTIEKNLFALKNSPLESIYEAMKKVMA